MKTGTILLLFLIGVMVAACTKMTPETQGTNNAQANIENASTATTDNATLAIDDPNLDSELVSDPLDEGIGALDELPIDESIPE